MTLPRTVALLKTWRFWNVRVAPSEAATQSLAWTSRPRRVTVPDVGGSTPLIMLNAVVLPAPLGPMSATISPAATSRSTWSSAGPRRALRQVAHDEQGRSPLWEVGTLEQPGQRLPVGGAFCTLDEGVDPVDCASSAAAPSVAGRTRRGELVPQLGEAAGHEDDDEDEDDAEREQAHLAARARDEGVMRSLAPSSMALTAMAPVSAPHTLPRPPSTTMRSISTLRLEASSLW